MTEQAEARERLRALGSEIIADAFEGFPDACTLSRAVRDASGRATDMELVWMNARARSGQPDPSGAIGGRCTKLWPQMVANGSFAACMRVLDNGQDERGEFEWTEGDTYLPAHYEWAAHRVGTELLLWVLRDASDKLNRTLESEARINAVLETVPDAIIVIDEAGKIASANPATDRLLGWPVEELIGRNVRELMPEHDSVRHDGYMNSYKSTGERRIIGIGRDVMAKHRDGHTIPVRLAVGEARVAGKRFFTGILHDLTERMHLEQQLQHAQKVELVGRLAGALAHDFNNLLTIITATTSWLHETISEPRASAAVVEIAEAAERAGSLTRQLLALSRRDIEPPRLIDPDAVVRKLGAMSSRIVKQQIHVVLETHANGWAVLADVASLEQAVLNLVVNAKDAMPNGGTLVIRSERLEVVDDGEVPKGDWVAIAVEDTGTGMPPEVRQRIFEPFFTTKSPEHGTGLGLVAVRDFTERSGGRVLVTTEVGKGTIARLVLKRALGTVPTARLRDKLELAGGTILLVDDERAIRTATTRALTARGYTVVCAADADEATREFERLSGAVDVLIADVTLRGTSGIALAVELIEKSPTMRVLFMSGYTPEAVLANALPGESAFLAKPFTLDELTGKVRELVASARASR